jgi:protein involved in polysaccharide export with SLBB domain
MLLKFTPSAVLGALLLASHAVAAPPTMADRAQRFGRDLPVQRATRVEPAEPPAAISSTAQIDDNYRLHPGDRVSYSVAEDRKQPIELVVLASGDVEVPGMGRFKAGNLTCRELAAKLKTELERSYYKKATVNIGLNQSGNAPLQNSANIRVYFLGAVRASGAREFPPNDNITVSKAILIAGGFGDFADQKKVQLIRKLPNGTSQVTVVNVADLLKGKPGNDPVIKAEDMIRVPEKLINF